MAKYPAAFINEIAEEGTKADAIGYLQDMWDEWNDLRESLRIYGGHIPPCAGRPCTCGFQKAWKDAKLPEV